MKNDSECLIGISFVPEATREQRDDARMFILERLGDAVADILDESDAFESMRVGVPTSEPMFMYKGDKR